MLAVNDLMTVNPKTITPETTLQEVLSLMNTEGYRHLPVVEDGQLVGIITVTDCLDYLATMDAAIMA